MGRWRSIGMVSSIRALWAASSSTEALSNAAWPAFVSTGGLPSASKDPKGYAAARAQIATWKKDPDVAVIARPLRYPDDYPSGKAEEKGIDVALAVDFVMRAVKGSYDVGIIMSLDTDLKPAM